MVVPVLACFPQSHPLPFLLCFVSRGATACRQFPSLLGQLVSSSASERWGRGGVGSRRNEEARVFLPTFSTSNGFSGCIPSVSLARTNSTPAVPASTRWFWPLGSSAMSSPCPSSLEVIGACWCSSPLSLASKLLPHLFNPVSTFKPFEFCFVFWLDWQLKWLEH